MMNWLQRVFSRQKRFDVEQALRDMLHRGIEIGKRQAEPIIIERRACRLHPVVLLNEIGPGHYICPLCQEECNTGPMRLSQPTGALMKQVREQVKRERPELIPNTQQMNAMYRRNHKGETR